MLCFACFDTIPATLELKQQQQQQQQQRTTRIKTFIRNLRRYIDPLHVRGNVANLEDRIIICWHENRSQFPEEKISFVLSSRLGSIEGSMHIRQPCWIYVVIYDSHVGYMLLCTTAMLDGRPNNTISLFWEMKSVFMQNIFFVLQSNTAAMQALYCCKLRCTTLECTNAD